MKRKCSNLWPYMFKAQLTFLPTCEGVDGSRSALLPSSSCCYSDGVLSPRLEVGQSGGSHIFRHCQLEQGGSFKQEQRFLDLNGFHCNK